MVAEGNVGVAFALVIGAGLCTTIGAAAAFYAKIASPKMLSMGLGLAAGVMLYVSFVEIFLGKGAAALEESWGESHGYIYATLLLFVGMFITFILDVLVFYISKQAGLNEEMTDSPDAKKASPAAKAADIPSLPKVLGEDLVMDDIEEGRREKDRTVHGKRSRGASLDEEERPVHLRNAPKDVPEDAAETVDTYMTHTNDHHRFGLHKMGLLTALAIGIHNIPEGLATFVAALSDPVNGVAIAIAIALHNLPEGVCVAMPVYYATGSRKKGLLWAFLSGMCEPIGGLIGYLFLYGGKMSDVAYGVLFCLVSGMMVYISVVELIPTSIRFDPSNAVTSKAIFIGMVIMAASLVAFTL